VVVKRPSSFGPLLQVCPHQRHRKLWRKLLLSFSPTRCFACSSCRLMQKAYAFRVRFHFSYIMILPLSLDATKERGTSLRPSPHSVRESVPRPNIDGHPLISPKIIGKLICATGFHDTSFSIFHPVQAPRPNVRVPASQGQAVSQKQITSLLPRDPHGSP